MNPRVDELEGMPGEKTRRVSLTMGGLFLFQDPKNFKLFL